MIRLKNNSIIASIYPCPFDVQDRHDMSVSIIKDDIIYAYEEDKLTSIKSDGTVKFPERSLMMGCKELNILPSDVNMWVLPTPSKPVDLKEQEMFFSWIFKAYKGSSEDFPKWYKEHISFIDHQIAHVALAVLASNFKECAFLCQDGGGDFGDQRDFIFGEYKDGKFLVRKEHYGIKTICSFHAFITDALGISGGNNGKTSGLSSYGNVNLELAKKYLNLLSIQENGIDFERERYATTGLNLAKIYPSEYDRGKILFHFPSDTNVLRTSIEYLPMDIAATGEHVLQTVFIDFLKKLRKQTVMEDIVFSGGLFQNVSLNNKILETKLFKKIFIPMAPSDAGLSLGQALYVENTFKKRKRNKPLSASLGPSFVKDEIPTLLERFRINFTKEDNIAKKSAELIAQGKVVGWFQGRGEYGPRALGYRSILADPRKMSSKMRINQVLKRRDWFMPYAPSILNEYLCDWVEIPQESPYMQIAFQVIEEKRILIPAAVHIDGSSRMHILNREDNELYWSLIDNFRIITGIPLILNTSFNRHGIATISTPRQAIEHLLEGCSDYLAIGEFLVDFKKNRIVSDCITEDKEENILLQEDCVKRLKDVFAHGNEKQVSNYMARLSRYIDIPFKFNDGKVIFEREGEFSVEEAIDMLLEKVLSLNV
ncbi:MAG: hypothetical protein GY777_07645 [Candidatus Brocadiaceae bacterium]|nr:hypothetical protein [Candidatus Brocadiaceae bacterium]